MPRWALAVPIAALVALAVGLALPGRAAALAVAAVALVAAVFAAVHHAEVVAHRVGEPFGTLVLALAVTVIEVALIVSMMLAGGPDSATVPRDTIFAAIMIIANGVMGLCLLVGGLRHREQSFRIEGATTGFGALIALASLSLVLPTFTLSTPGPTYTPAQLAFAGSASLVLWGVFTFFQTVRHRHYFLAAGAEGGEHAGAARPTTRLVLASLVLLAASLVAVVGLAKVLSPAIESGLAAAGAPRGVVGIAIAMLVLLPETVAAVRAARANRVQTSLNLAMGSALASIGLTIPAVAAASVLLDLPLVLGLGAKEMVQLLTTFLVGAITLGTGRTNMMQGAVHLAMFAGFLFLALVP